MKQVGRSQACRGRVCLCRSTVKDSLTARTALYLSTTTRLRVGEFQEHTRVSVIVSIHVIIV